MECVERAEVTVRLFLEGGEEVVQKFEGYSDISISQKRGFIVVGDEAPELSLDGQQRVCIKLWKGCPSYDEFKSTER